MKILNFSLAFTLLFSVASAAEVCIQSEQPAVSTEGVCQVFSTPCEVPDDWKAIPSCALVSGEGREARISLEDKMKERRNKIRERLKAKRAAQESEKKENKHRANAKTHRMATGAYTRQWNRNHRLSTKENVSTQDLRTSTKRNYNQIKIRKQYSNKGGYKDENKEKVDKSAYNRPAQISATNVKRSGNLKTTVKWTTLSKQHMRKRSYGKNPYSIKSKHAAKQKANRDKTNQAVDVEARKRSGTRIWRGEKEDGNIEAELMDK